MRSVVSTDQWLDHIGIYTPTPTKHQQGRKKLKTAYSQQNVSQCGENFYEIAVETSNFCGNYFYIRCGRVIENNIDHCYQVNFLTVKKGSLCIFQCITLLVLKLLYYNNALPFQY